MSPEIRKTTNCDSNTKGLSYGLLDYVFNLAAGRNIGLKMSKQNILFKANSLILMSLGDYIGQKSNFPHLKFNGVNSEPFKRSSIKVLTFEFRGSEFKAHVKSKMLICEL